MTNDKLPVPEGTVLHDKYEVGRLLGRGGMGVVMAARHLLLDTDVALKFLTTSDPDVVARFSREARAAARIQSEHVARVIDVGALDDGSPFIVMEYLAGEDLSEVLARGPLAPVEAVDYVLQACEAIAEAHALGIVHRDLKPANLFLARRAHGRSMVKVLDFGISRGGARGMPTLTGTALLGSPQYMSPEQWTESRAVDARSDLWSLGVVLYEMMAGRRPFDGPNFPAIFTAIANDAPEPLSPGVVPPGLAAVVYRCLEKDAARRFPDVASLASALGGFGSAASRPLLDRIAHISGFKRTAVADTSLAESLADTWGTGGDASVGGETSTARAEAAVAAMKVEIGGTAVLSPSQAERVRAGTSVLVEEPAPEPVQPVPARPKTSRRDGAARDRAPATGRGGTAPARAPATRRDPAPPARRPSSFPVKVASLALGAVGVLAVAAVVIVKATGGSRTPSSTVERPARTPPPAPTPPPATASPPSTTPPALTTVPTPTPPAASAPAVPTPTPTAAAVPAAPPKVPAPETPVEAPPAERPKEVAAPPARGAAPADRVAPARERSRANTRPGQPAPSRAGIRWSARCSRFLERQSLGETLSKDDLAIYMRECRR